MVRACQSLKICKVCGHRNFATAAAKQYIPIPLNEMQFAACMWTDYPFPCVYGPCRSQTGFYRLCQFLYIEPPSSIRLSEALL